MAQSRYLGLWALMTVAALGLAASVNSALAQSPAARPAPVPAPGDGVGLDIDMLALLRSRDVFWNTAEDAIWIVRPGPGKNLVQVPVLVKPGKLPTTLTGSEIKLRGGRFLAWKLTDDPELAPKNSDAARQIDAAMGNDIPRFTRRLTVNPDGSMQWPMERVIPGGEVKKSTPTPRLYQMAIKREFLNELQPTPPVRTRDPGEAAASQAAYRIAHRTYLQTLKEVNDLPQDFKESMPERIWAIFELPAHIDKLDLVGLQTGDWRVEMDVMRRLREFCKSPVELIQNPDGSNSIGVFAEEMVFRLSEIASNPASFDHRVVAYVLSLSGLVKHAQLGDPLFLLVKTLLDGGDSLSQQIMVKELLRVIPPTRATASLMQLVAQKGIDAASSVNVLENLTLDLANNPDQVQKVLATTQQMLDDPKGPPPPDVLAALYKSARDQPQAFNALANGVRFKHIPPDRRHLAMVDVVEQSGVEPLAAHWLNSQFLGSADPEMLEKTLQIIISAESDRGSASVAPLVRGGMNVIFGQPKTADAKTTRNAKLRGLIPINTSNHGLYRALQHGDARLRTLAWQALNQFELAQTGQEEQEIANRSTDRYQVLLELALNQAPTPPQVVAFFARQPDQVRATAAIVQLVMRGGAEASTAASRALMGSDLPLSDAMLALVFGERQGFTMRMYENLTGRSAPFVTAMMRQRTDRNPLVVWFGQQIAQGELPKPETWAAQCREAELIELAASNDAELARGAVAALVNHIGGTDREARDFAQELRRLPDQSATNLTAQWQEYRRGFYTRTIDQRYGGQPYRLILRVFEPQPVTAPGQAPSAPQQPNSEASLGVVRLEVNGATVSIAPNVAVSVPGEQMALRIDKPVELKNLPNSEEIAKVPLDEVQQPVDLRPQSDGTWKGEVGLSAGRRLEVLMQPARDGA